MRAFTAGSLIWEYCLLSLRFSLIVAKLGGGGRGRGKGEGEGGGGRGRGKGEGEGKGGGERGRGAGALREPMASNRSFPVLSILKIILAAFEIFRHMIDFRSSKSR